MKTFSLLLIGTWAFPVLVLARYPETIVKPVRGQYERSTDDIEAERRAIYMSPKAVEEVVWKTVCHPTGGYCFEHPDTWEMYMNAKETAVVLNRIAKDITDERRGRIYIYNDTDRYAQRSSDDLDKDFNTWTQLHTQNTDPYYVPSFSFISAEDIEFLGFSGRHFSYTGEIKSVKMRHDLYMARPDGKYYVTRFSSPIEQYDEDRLVFERMIASFEMKKSSTVQRTHSEETPASRPLQSSSGSSLRSRADARRNERLLKLAERVEVRRQERLRRSGMVE